MTYLVITDEGKMIAVNPADWRFVADKEDLEAGKYEPKMEL